MARNLDEARRSRARVKRKVKSIGGETMDNQGQMKPHPPKVYFIDTSSNKEITPNGKKDLPPELQDLQTYSMKQGNIVEVEQPVVPKKAFENSEKNVDYGLLKKICKGAFSMAMVLSGAYLVNKSKKDEIR